MNSEPSTVQNQPSKTLYRTPVFTRVLLLVIITAGSVLSACMPDMLTAALCGACTAGVFAFYYLLTFSPAAVLVVIPAFLVVLLYHGNVLSSASVLLFLPAGAVLSLCMLGRKKKTTAVISTAAALGLSILVLFLIRYMTQNGTIALSSLRASYDSMFEQTRAVLLESVKQTVQNAVAQNEALADYYTDAFITTVVNASVDSIKLAMPAVIIVFCELLGFLSVSVYLLFAKLFRCRILVPRGYRITMTRAAGVIFMISYLINLFSSGNSMSLLQVTAGNIASVLMPGLFLMGLRSLKRRAASPNRRRSFIITAVILGLLLFTYPIYAVLFIVLDGLGEVFFGDKMLF